MQVAVYLYEGCTVLCRK